MFTTSSETLNINDPRQNAIPGSDPAVSWGRQSRGDPAERKGLLLTQAKTIHTRYSKLPACIDGVCLHSWRIQFCCRTILIHFFFQSETIDNAITSMFSGDQRKNHVVSSTWSKHREEYVWNWLGTNPVRRICTKFPHQLVSFKYYFLAPSWLVHALW